MPESLAFDDAIDVLRRRLLDADHLNESELHRFKELMRDYNAVLPSHFYWEALEELKEQGHLHPASTIMNGGDACARLSADGRAYLRLVEEQEEH
jgi:hypothetical protein